MKISSFRRRFPNWERRLAGTGAAVTAAATIGTIATDPDTRWYKRLDKPPFQPPTWLFPVAWTALYADIAVVSALALARFDAKNDGDEATNFRRALAANLVLNAGWSLLFFRGKTLLPATIEAAVLAASTADLTRRAATADPGLGAALSPYAAWTAFATVLTGSIADRNTQ